MRFPTSLDTHRERLPDTNYFADIYQHQWATWNLLSDIVQMKIIKDTKKSIQKGMRQKGVLETEEPIGALEDPDTNDYLNYLRSGDEGDMENSNEYVESLLEAKESPL